jgi:hypothetical protein
LDDLGAVERVLEEHPAVAEAAAIGWRPEPLQAEGYTDPPSGTPSTARKCCPKTTRRSRASQVKGVPEEWRLFAVTT